MKILIFDTETTGLPERGASIYNYNKWPYIIQISYILYDISTNEIQIKDNYIKIDNSIPISNESYEKHKITHNILDEEGIDIETAMKEFNYLLKICDIVVAHNISFDKRMIFVECLRNNIAQNFTIFNNSKKIQKREFCTMKNTKEFCNIIKLDKSNNTYFKFPSLIELYLKLFPEANIPTEMHNSLVDISITLKCYIKFTYNLNITEINQEVKDLFIKYNCL